MHLPRNRLLQRFAHLRKPCAASIFSAGKRLRTGCQGMPSMTFFLQHVAVPGAGF